jgi:hypothetical protein
MDEFKGISLLQGKVNALGELQSARGEELSTLVPSILDK